MRHPRTRAAAVAIALLGVGVGCSAESDNPVATSAAGEVVPSETEALQALRTTVGLSMRVVSDSEALDAASATCEAFNSGRQTFDRMFANIISDQSITAAQRSTHMKVLSWSVAYFCPWHATS